MVELTDFFPRAFSATKQVLGEQGVQPVGPPFGKYYDMPGKVVDVEAGFPVATAIEAAGRVVPGTLPGGRVVEATHIGPYDTMETTSAEVQRGSAISATPPRSPTRRTGTPRSAGRSRERRGRAVPRALLTLI